MAYQLQEEDVIITLAHPHGNIETSLTHWIATGPGPRPLLRPVAAKGKRTGKALPLSVIPLRYRNTNFSRILNTLTIACQAVVSTNIPRKKVGEPKP